MERIKMKSRLPFTWTGESVKVAIRKRAARRRRPESFIVFAVVN